MQEEKHIVGKQEKKLQNFWYIVLVETLGCHAMISLQDVGRIAIDPTNVDEVGIDCSNAAKKQKRRGEGRGRRNL